MQKITIGIQPLAELRAEILAVARGEREADPDAPLTSASSDIAH
jgi:hypothetical protein